MVTGTAALRLGRFEGRVVNIGRALKCGVAVLLASMLLATPAQATTAEVVAEVSRTLAIAGDRFGGCMVALTVAPSEEGLDCPARWVTFSCTGVHTDKSSALRMYDSAVLAFAMGRTVRVWVDDTKKHNGHCFGSRIDVESGD